MLIEWFFTYLFGTVSVNLMIFLWCIGLPCESLWLIVVLMYILVSKLYIVWKSLKQKSHSFFRIKINTNNYTVNNNSIQQLRQDSNVQEWKRAQAKLYWLKIEILQILYAPMVGYQTPPPPNSVANISHPFGSLVCFLLNWWWLIYLLFGIFFFLFPRKRGEGVRGLSNCKAAGLTGTFVFCCWIYVKSLVVK